MKKCFEITGICSGDCESDTMDVTEEEYIKLCGRYPEKYDRSHFYKGRYRYYGFDMPFKLLKDFTEGDILKIKAIYEIEKVGHEEGSSMLCEREWGLT